MGLFRESQTEKDANLLAEERLYEFVSNEVANGEIRSGIWAKAAVSANSSRHEDITREYIGLRVEHLKAEGRLFQQFHKEASALAKESDKDYERRAAKFNKLKKKEEKRKRAARRSNIVFGGIIIIFVLWALLKGW